MYLHTCVIELLYKHNITLVDVRYMAVYRHVVMTCYSRITAMPIYSHISRLQVCYCLYIYIYIYIYIYKKKNYLQKIYLHTYTLRPYIMTIYLNIYIFVIGTGNTNTRLQLLLVKLLIDLITGCEKLQNQVYYSKICYYVQKTVLPREILVGCS